MAWIKDLGNVKGETGKVYIPQISVKDGEKLHFSWVIGTEQEAENILENGIDFPIPVYMPSQDPNDDDYTIFDISAQAKNKYGTNVFQPIRLNLRGPTGYADPKFDIIAFQGDHNNIENPQENKFYVNKETSEVYIYDGADFIALENLSVALNDYYKRSETYSRAEIDDMFSEVNAQQQRALQLLDIGEIIDSVEESDDI